MQNISKAAIKLIIQEPFYGHFFTHIQKKSNLKIERVNITLTETGSILLEVNEEYWKTLSLDLKIGCIKHQILHIVFKHIYSIKKYGNTNLFNIASDLVVNQYLKKDQRDVNAIILDDFPFLNLKTKESVGYYYKRLQEVPLLNSTSSSNAEDEIEKQKIISEHKGWSSFHQQSGAEKKITEEKLDRYAQMSAKRLKTTDFGSLPGELQTYLNEVEERLNPAVNWKRMLRLFIQSSRKTYLKTTLKKPSRRYGTLPGIKIKQQQKILIAIDTSGSIDEDDLNNFFSEIYHVWKQTPDIKIVLCDTIIHDQYSYKGVLPKIVGGGGGTDFNPPIQFSNKYSPDVLLYFTDGHAPCPVIKSRTPIIWIISSDGLSSSDNGWHELPGRKVKLSSN